MLQSDQIARHDMHDGATIGVTSSYWVEDDGYACRTGQVLDRLAVSAVSICA